MAIAVLSILLATCLIYIFNNTASIQIERLIRANKNHADGMNKLIDAQQNEITALKDEVIASNKFIASLVKLSVHERIAVMQAKSPTLNVTQDFIYKIDDIHSMYIKNEIQPNEYFIKVNSILDEIHPH